MHRQYKNLSFRYIPFKSGDACQLWDGIAQNMLAGNINDKNCANSIFTLVMQIRKLLCYDLYGQHCSYFKLYWVKMHQTCSENSQYWE